MDFDGALFTSFAATRSSPHLSRTPALSRPRRTASTSSASTCSASSPTLVTPRYHSATRTQEPPPRLDFAGAEAWLIGELREEGEGDFLGPDLVKVLNLTPRLPDATLSSYPSCVSTDSARDESARPDTSPLLRPSEDWTLPLLPERQPSSSMTSEVLKDVMAGSGCDVLSISSASNNGQFSKQRGYARDTQRDPVETLLGTEFHHHAHRGASNGSSVISTVSCSSSSSLRSLQSDLSNPPSIPDRISSRKRPTLPGRVSSLKPAQPAVRFAPTLPPTSRRRSSSSVRSAHSVLDPHPVLSSPPTHLTHTSPHATIRPRKQLRASSFTPTTLPPIADSSVDFSAVPFTGLENYERHHPLRRISSAPYLRTWRINSDMPSTPLRADRAPRTPPLALPSRNPSIDFSASPGSTSSRTRRLHQFSLDALGSRKPSSAIEYIAGRRDSNQSDRDIVIPLYDAALSPRTSVHLRPAANVRHRHKLSDDLYSECRKADKLHVLIHQAGVEEAAEAIQEAETWSWARPPLREGRVLKAVRQEGEGEEDLVQRHGRHQSGTSFMSGRSAFGSDMGLSTSHSVATISEEAAIVTPSSSAALLAVHLPTVVEPVTPTSQGSLLAGADITPKAPARAEGSMSLRRSTSQTGTVPPIPEARSRGVLTKKSLVDFRGRKKAEEAGSRGKDSVGSGARVKKDRFWSVKPDLTYLGAMAL